MENVTDNNPAPPGRYSNDQEASYTLAMDDILSSWLAVFVTISITRLILSNNGLCCGVSTLIIIIPSLLIPLLLMLLREDFLFVSRTLPRSYLDELVFKCSVL